jgi:hypothetical protein
MLPLPGHFTPFLFLVNRLIFGRILSPGFDAPGKTPTFAARFESSVF